MTLEEQLQQLSEAFKQALHPFIGRTVVNEETLLAVDDAVREVVRKPPDHALPVGVLRAMGCFRIPEDWPDDLWVRIVAAGPSRPDASHPDRVVASVEVTPLNPQPKPEDIQLERDEPS